MTLKKLKEELKYLHKKNADEVIERKYWESLRSRRDWCRAQGMIKEADSIDKTLPTDTVKAKISDVTPLVCRYSDIFNLLKDEDRRMSILCFIEGKSYGTIGKITKYSYDTVRFRFLGGERNGYYYIGIYQKILNIINGGG